MPRAGLTAGSSGSHAGEPSSAHAAAPDLELPVTTIAGRWGALRFEGSGRLRLTSDSVIMEASRGVSLRAAFTEITGAAWRTGSLVIHGVDGRVAMEADAGLEGAWVALVSRACPLPEFTRAYRRLGSRRGGPPELQARFLTPLLQARRMLQDEAELDRRVAALDPAAIRSRLTEAMASVARETYPDSAPDRRALVVELEEALAPVFRRITLLEEAAARFTTSDEASRFLAWRDWVDTAALMFTHADRAWTTAAELLPGRLSR